MWEISGSRREKCGILWDVVGNCEKLWDSVRNVGLRDISVGGIVEKTFIFSFYYLFSVFFPFSKSCIVSKQ